MAPPYPTNTPNGNGSHPRTQGKAKVGRVSASEPLFDASSGKTPETMDETGILSPT